MLMSSIKMAEGDLLIFIKNNKVRFSPICSIKGILLLHSFYFVDKHLVYFD